MEQYHFVDANNQKAGPIYPTDFATFGITGDTLVWRPGLSQWVKASTLPELASYLSAPEIPQPEPPQPPLQNPGSSQTPTPPPTGPATGGYHPHGSAGEFFGTGGSAYGSAGKAYDPYAPKPDNNLIWGILATILCCWPLGIVSIVKAVKVDRLWAAGQQDAARQAAEEAKKFAIISAACGLVIFVIAFIAGLAESL